MKVSHKETRTVEEEVVDDILCNKCGNSCKHSGNFHGLIEQKIHGGYGSRLGDQTCFLFSLCEDCLAVIFLSCKIPVQQWDHHGVLDEFDDEAPIV